MSEKQATGSSVTGSQALMMALERQGVEVIFGLPGGAILPAYDPLIDSSIRHILVRHEQGAGHMAEGYAQVTGRPGVAMVTSGPGATNIVTPICNAFIDSIPLVVITGQVPYGAIGTDAFQECDTTGITMPITKHNFLVAEAQDLPQVIHDAFHIASTGRPGPVLVDIPKCVLDPKNPRSQLEYYEPGTSALRGYNPEKNIDGALIDAAIDLIEEAQRPVLYCGGGILKSRAAETLKDFAELTQIPVVTTLMNRGGFPDSHPLCLGMPGMHGNYTATTSMQKSDLLIALGARFDDRVTGNVEGFAPEAKIIHVDIDPAELGKVKPADVRIEAGCKEAIELLIAKVAERNAGAKIADQVKPWRATLDDWKKKYPLKYSQDSDSSVIKPQFVLEKLAEACPDDTIITTGVGQHQMWASQLWKFDHPYTFVNSGGLGTMGFAVPAAIGAKVGKPNKMVWAIDGDGCFQMTAQELVTAATERIPVKIAILNNAYLGMVRQWQEMFYEERYSEVYLSPDLPDYKAWAEAMGCEGIRVDGPEEVESTIAKANEIDDRPVVIDFRVDAQEKLYPMVPPGASNDDIVLGGDE